MTNRTLQRPKIGAFPPDKKFLFRRNTRPVKSFELLVEKCFFLFFETIFIYF
jgi:hypothetical protein